MNRQIEISPELYEEEVVHFLADRYQTSVENIMSCFLIQNGTDYLEQGKESMTLRLEENEMEILRGLTHINHS